MQEQSREKTPTSKNNKSNSVLADLHDHPGGGDGVTATEDDHPGRVAANEDDHPGRVAANEDAHPGG